MVSAPSIPEGREKIVFDPIIDGDASFDVEPVSSRLGADFFTRREDVYFRYTYETGSGTGDEATAKFIAEANLDPTTPGHYTFVRELSVDEGEVVSEVSVDNNRQ